MSSIKTQTLKGFRDFLPQEARKRQYVIRQLAEVFESYGFEPLETPALEYEEVLLGKYGEEGDKLMYRFKDLGGRKVAMRYDQTVPLARVVSQYGNGLPMPFKRYQIQPVWRAEKPQKGRYREFLQCDADIVGTSSPLADAETIALTIKSMENLGFKNFKVFINDRAIFSDLSKRGTVDEKDLPFVVRTLDKIKKIGKEKVLEELSRKFSPEQATYLIQNIENKKPTENLQEIFRQLEQLGIRNFSFSPTLARGLDYYTGMIFEIEIEGYSAGSVCGGGRYDNLIGLFAGKQISAVGFAFGFDRLMEAMDELKLFPPDITASSAKVLITIFSPELKEKSLALTPVLRSNGVQTEIYLDENAKLDKQLKYADQKGIPYAVIIGPDEAKENKVTLKNMRTGEQKTVSQDSLLKEIA